MISKAFIKNGTLDLSNLLIIYRQETYLWWRSRVICDLETLSIRAMIFRNNFVTQVGTISLQSALPHSLGQNGTISNIETSKRTVNKFWMQVSVKGAIKEIERAKLMFLPHNIA